MKNLISRYILVGMINTFFTAAIILTLTYLGVGIYISNVTGYVLGIILSFILNSIFTFSSEIKISNLLKFIFTSAISYLFNLIIIKLILIINPEGKYLPQILGMISYTLIGFNLNKKWAMK